MADKSERRLFIEELVSNWQYAFKKRFPEGGATRDERFVALRTRMASHDDVRSILEVVWPDPRSDIQSPVAKEWLCYHKRWVRRLFPEVLTAAVRELRDFKRHRRAELRATYKTVRRRGRKGKIRARGPLPPLRVQIFVPRHRAAKK